MSIGVHEIILLLLQNLIIDKNIYHFIYFHS